MAPLTFRIALFQAHWLVGITAGVVLGIVGLTGAILSFESDIQRWLNSDVRRVEHSAAVPLSLTQLVSEVGRQMPDKHITALVLSGDPTESVRVTFAASAESERAASGSRGRGETRYVNPRTGELIAGDGARGQEFFRTTRSLHRWLTADLFGNQQLGRHIVGASTLLCVLLVLSGLYLRWPRRPGSLRMWLTFNPALKGRTFLWHLHAIVGTWVLVALLLMSLTGLYWSYDWYRNGLYAISGVERPAPRGGVQRSGARNAANRDGRESQLTAPPTLDLQAVWTTFNRETAATSFSTATITWPREVGQPVEIRYAEADPQHNRATNTLVVSATDGTVVRHERYATKRVGEKFMSSIFAIHSGSFFGLAGVITYMLASLTMPLFTVTGWMMYLGRRRRKKRAAVADRSGATATSTV